MSGPGGSTSKASWRERFHLRRSSKPATSKPTRAAGQSFYQNRTAPITTPVASTFSVVSNKLLQGALKRLNDEERTKIEGCLLSRSADIQTAVQGAIDEAQAKRRICLDKRWFLTIGGKDVVLREQADKVIHWLDRFKAVGDLAANADPIHAGLPWTGVRLLLETVVTDSNQMAALLAGCETTLYIASRLEVYVDYWYGLTPAAASDNLEESIIILYAHLLRFLAQAIMKYETWTFKRVFSALWKVDEVLDFERSIEDLAARVERDANCCDRVASVRNQKLWYESMQKALAELDQYHQLQASSDQLHVKIDISKIPYAEGAIFDAYDGIHSLCHPATRKDLIDQAQIWAQQRDGKSVFWLHGPAGSGKSTISWTVAQWLTDQAGNGDVDIGASFFFKRGEGDRGSAKRFFPTLVRQLITKIPGLDAAVAKVVELEPLIFDKAIAEQFRRLILRPLQNASFTASQPTLVVVIDALDECEKEIEIATILKLLSELAQYTTPLRIFLTSRYEPSIFSVVKEISLSFDIIRGMDLIDEVPLDTIGHDLTVYLIDSFATIHRDYNYRHQGMVALDSDWADREKIDQLVEIATPLFIIAATICRFVGDLRFDPQIRLAKILERRSSGNLPQIELAYASVLSYLSDHSIDDESREELCRNFRNVVGSIIVLAEPLSRKGLAHLLDVSLRSIDQQLAPLHSVLRIPTDEYTAIRTLHLSFAEFLLHEKAQEQPYGVLEKSAHLALSRYCINLLSSRDGLCENICSIDYPGQPRSEVKPNTISSCLSPELCYACRYWVFHIQQSGYPIQDQAEVHNFLEEHFLHWLEALSLMNRVSEALDLLVTLQSCVSATASALSAFLEDGRRFVLANRHIVNLAPLQLYSSATIFAPQASLVRKICAQSPRWILQYPKSPGQWSSVLQTLEGHSWAVWTVAFSPSGLLLASGSGDRTVRLWDPKTGRELQRLDGHSDEVFAVAFSRNNSLLASGSADTTILLWDPQTGEVQGKLVGHSSIVRTLAFSDSLLASGSEDKSIRLWDLQSGQEIRKLEGHSKGIWCVTFSHSGCLLASGSDDKSVRVWDPKTGKETHKLEGHSSLVSAVAFSPSGLLGSGSMDGTIRIWNLETNQETRNLTRSSSWFTSMLFSHNAYFLASGSQDQTARRWDLRTGQEVQKLEGHSESIWSIASTYDDSLLASGSGDYTIRIWDLQSHLTAQKPQGHLKTVATISFSHDGSLLASGSEDRTIRLWDPHKNHELRRLEGHDASITSMMWSCDDSLLVSASIDRTVRLWNPQTGKEIRKLQGHSDRIWDVAFSFDSSLLASGAGDKTVRLWEPQTGLEIQRLDHSSKVKAVAFSHDAHIIASVSGNHEVRLWDVPTGKFRQKLGEINSMLRAAVAFSHDGSSLASSFDKTIRLWDLRTGKTIRTFRSASTIDRIQFTEDDKMLVTDKEVFPIEKSSLNIGDSQSDKNCTLDISGSWIRRNGQNLLWLPHEYRGTSAISNGMLAIGAYSGAVSVFRFDFS